MKIENIELQKLYVYSVQLYTVIGMEVQIKKFNWILFVG